MYNWEYSLTFSYSCLHGHLRVRRAMNIWTRNGDGYIQECTVFCAKALYLSQSKVHPKPVRNWVSCGGLNYFDHISARVIPNTAFNWTAKYGADSSTVSPSMLYFYLMWTLITHQSDQSRSCSWPIMQCPITRTWESTPKQWAVMAIVEHKSPTFKTVLRGLIGRIYLLNVG